MITILTTPKQVRGRGLMSCYEKHAGLKCRKCGIDGVDFYKQWDKRTNNYYFTGVCKMCHRQRVADYHNKKKGKGTDA